MIFISDNPGLIPRVEGVRAARSVTQTYDAKIIFIFINTKLL